MTTWLTLAQAAARTGLTTETIRKWATADPPRVAAKPVMVGKKKRWEVDEADVDREALLTESTIRTATRHGEAQTPSVEQVDALVRGRTAALGEVTRIYRFIDELRGEIEERHLQIERLQREVAALLDAPALPPTR